MKCIKCSSDNTGCTDSRPTTKLGFPSQRRRWKCEDCDARYTSWELSEVDIEFLKGKDGFALNQMRELIEHLEKVA